MSQGTIRRAASRRLAQLAAAAAAAIFFCAHAVRAGPIEQDQCDPNSGIVYVPGQGTNGFLLFEDNWPMDGDLDFNDQVIAYNYEFLLDTNSNVVMMKVTFNVLAVGADFENGLYLHLPLAAGNADASITDQDGNNVQPIDSEFELVIPIVNDTRDLFSAGDAALEQFINTEPYLPVRVGKPLSLTITFLHGVSLPVDLVPYDLFIARSVNFGFQIHMPQYPGTDAMDTSLFDSGDDASTSTLHFINKRGLPFAIALPEEIVWPQETVPLDLVYPEVDNFAASGGTESTDWYKSDVVLANGYTSGADNEPPPTPIAVGSDLICAPEAPSIHYFDSGYACQVDIPCSLDGPSNDGGGATSYTISPELPAGLSMNSVTGQITGTATAIFSPGREFTVTASNTGGSVTTTVTISVDDAPPSQLAYLPNWALTCTVGVPCTSVAPTTEGGAPTSYGITPAPPAGLSMNPLTGIISGTPTKTHPAEYIYEVSANNSGGGVTAWISIEVDAAH